jgi:hypothetical protein
MTTQKGFKTLVRARMAKTGERYAAARRALMADHATDTSDPSPTRTAGLNPDSAALARALADGGVVSPLDGRPLTEAMILGIAGGLGAGYILWEFKTHQGAYLTLGFTNQWQYPGIPGWYGNALDRSGIEADLHETGGAVGAQAALDAALDGGRTAIAFVDQQSIGTWGQPDALAGYSGYPVAIVGRTDDGGYRVDDRGLVPLEVDRATMARARGRIGSWKHRLIVPTAGPGEIPPDRLRQAVRDGLAHQVDHLRSSSDSFSLPAWRKWSRLMTDTRNAKAWPRVFAEGNGLLGALLSIVEGVDGNVGATGGHLRERYAEFLDEVSAAGFAPMTEAAGRWREAADRWEDLADAAIPPDLDGAMDAVAAAEELHDAVMAGEPGRGRARAAADRLWTIRDEYATGASISESRMLELFADLGERLAGIYAAEVAALGATARAIGR